MVNKRQNRPSDFHLSKKEIQDLIYAPDNFRDRVLIKLLWFTGMRRAEVAELDVRDLDVERQRIHVRDGKGGKSRVVFATADLFSDLKHYLGRRNKGPLFPSNRDPKKTITPRLINYIVANAGKKAGLKHPDPSHPDKVLSPHLLRHSFSWHYKKTLKFSVETLQTVLGHSNIQTTLQLYGTESVDEAQANYQEAAEQMFS